MQIKRIYEKYKKAAREFILYGIIGMLTSLLDTCCYAAFTRCLGWNKFIANLCSVNAGILCSFLLNTYFNFRKVDKIGKRAVSFFGVGYCGMGLSMILLYVGVDMAGFNDMIVKILGIAVTALFQFVLNKAITFSRI